MRLLDQIYGGVVSTRNSLYDRQIFKPLRLSWPVVSVGNISAGGSGKTPFVIMLGRLLAERGIWIDVLSRGYGRCTRGVLTVNAQGRAEQFGDEPLLIARKLRFPVIVGESRYAAGLRAEHEYQGEVPNAIHLLDDGFQHRQLHRNFDIVLLHREDLNDKLLPSGRLRESLSSLRRADAVVVDAVFPEDLLPEAGLRLWRIERQIELPKLHAPVIAFCGIARPHRFFSELRTRGIDLREEITFRDHRRYTRDDTQRLAAAQARIPGSLLVTTEKDAVNLGAYFDALRPIVVPLQMRLADAETALKSMLGTIAERRVCP